MICPKCKTETISDECVGCGVIISKYNRTMENKALEKELEKTNAKITNDAAAPVCPACGMPTGGKLNCRSCGINIAKFAAIKNSKPGADIQQVKLLAMSTTGDRTHICTSCGQPGTPIKKTKGSFGLELLLWLFFFIPGLIYSIWRLSSKYMACPACGGATMIPIGSPMGQKLMKDMF